MPVPPAHLSLPPTPSLSHRAPCGNRSLVLKAMADPQYAVYLDDAIAREARRRDGVTGARCVRGARGGGGTGSSWIGCSSVSTPIHLQAAGW